MRFSIEKIKKVIDGLKDDLGEGFVDTDIWNTGSSKSIAFHHQQGLIPQYGMIPKHIRTFNDISKTLIKTLEESDYPPLGDYYLINMTNNYVAVVLNYKPAFSTDDPANQGRGSSRQKFLNWHQQYLLVDLSKTSMGVLMSVAIPKVLKTLQ